VEKLHGDPTVGPTPQGQDQRSKMEEVVPNMVRRRAQMWDNSRGGELDLKLQKVSYTPLTSRRLYLVVRSLPTYER